MIKRVSLFLLAAAIAALIVSCEDENDYNPGDIKTGIFNARITDTTEKVIEGAAVFGVVIDPDFGGSFFILSLYDKGGDYSIELAIGGERPGVGTYSITEIDERMLGEEDEWLYFMEDFVSWYREFDGASTHMALSRSGSVTFSQSSADNMSGDFDFTAKVVNLQDPDSDKTINISGNFSAVYAYTN